VKNGFIPVSLGGRVMRCETAGLAVLSILQHEWGDI
jgi:16S rRNA U1498 N3-methylase RsmE